MVDKIKIVNQLAGSDVSFVTQINPNSVKIGKKVNYARLQAIGSNEYIAKYKHHEPSTMSFEIYFDDTGAIPNADGSNIAQRIEKLEAAVYNIKESQNEPGYVVLVWGNTIFHGRAESINYDYSLFAPDGTPLRVKISLSFIGSFENSSSQDPNTQSAQVVTFSAGDSLVNYCESIYSDSSYCTDVAAANGLDSIRNITSGSVVIFPPLKR